MPAAHSEGLAWRVVWRSRWYGQSPQEITDPRTGLGVSRAYVRDVLARFDRTGDVATHQGQGADPLARRALTRLECLQIVGQLVSAPRVTLKDQRAQFVLDSGVTISYGAFCRAVKALGYTRKIIRAVAYQADTEKADAWLREVLTYHSASELGVLDETSKDLEAANRGFGYSLRGTDCTTQAPRVHTVDPHTLPLARAASVTEGCSGRPLSRGDPRRAPLPPPPLRTGMLRLLSAPARHMTGCIFATRQQARVDALPVHGAGWLPGLGHDPRHVQQGLLSPCDDRELPRLAWCAAPTHAGAPPPPIPHAATRVPMHPPSPHLTRMRAPAPHLGSSTTCARRSASAAAFFSTTHPFTAATSLLRASLRAAPSCDTFHPTATSCRR